MGVSGASSAGAPTAAPDLPRLSRALAHLLHVTPAALQDMLVAASAPDLPALMALRREVIGGDLRWDDAAYLRWRFLLDGARLPVLREGSRGCRMWLVKRGDELLGCLGADQVTLSFRRNRIPTLRFFDMMVQPRINGLGLGAWLALMVINEAEAGISVGGNEQSLPMIERLFHRMPDRRTWSLPLRSRPMLALRLGALAAVPGLPRVLDMGLTLRRVLNGRRSGLKLEVNHLADVVPAIDELSDTMVEAGITFVTRSAEAWRWRFLQNPRRHYTLREARYQGRIAALVVSSDEGEVAEIVDWVWDATLPPELSRRIRSATFAAIIEEIARAGASRVRVMTYEDESDRLLRALGMARRVSRAGYAVRARTPELHAGLTADPQHWFVTFGDGDGD